MGQTTSTNIQAAPASCPVDHSVLAKPSSPAQCPIDHSSTSTHIPSTTSSPAAAQCPIDHSSTSRSASQSTQAPAQCPIDHGSTTLDPRNNLPTLSQAPAPDQALELPTERETSSIPRDEGSRWEYPSPQQFYNALVRKGWETPEEHVETMVQIHNFLNEQAWEEVCKWEETAEGRREKLQLARFKGRPGELSPKARLHLLAGWLLPSRFNSEPPFDRHDWIIRRPNSNTEIRYIIDYYSAPPLPDGSPVFSLDVRPALDTAWGVTARAQRAWDELKTSRLAEGRN
ncbi:cytochrome c and c1 heme-lyase [Amylostereum chailletii]|nr:cytochrome c and c1 heme-lyase [Amylostereum chailletii]